MVGKQISRTIKQLIMNGLELLKEHPKSAIVVKQWYLDLLLESLKDDNLPEDFKNYAREAGIDDERIGAMIDASPRGLLDVFDGQKVYISVEGSAKGFVWNINNGEKSSFYNSRKNAESEAIVNAFKLLEEKL